FDDASEAWGRAYELLPRRRRRERLALGLALAEVGDVVGGGAAQHEVLVDVVELARQRRDEAALLRALVLLGGAAARRGDTVESQRALGHAVDLAERLGDRHALADATYRRGDLLIQSGQWEHGRAQLTAALELVDPQHDRLLHGRVLRGLAICAVRMGRPTEAVARLE